MFILGKYIFKICRFEFHQKVVDLKFRVITEVTQARVEEQQFQCWISLGPPPVVALVTLAQDLHKACTQLHKLTSVLARPQLLANTTLVQVVLHSYCSTRHTFVPANFYCLDADLSVSRVSRTFVHTFQLQKLSSADSSNLPTKLSCLQVMHI